MSVNRPDPFGALWQIATDKALANGLRVLVDMDETDRGYAYDGLLLEVAKRLEDR